MSGLIQNCISYRYNKTEIAFNNTLIHLHGEAINLSPGNQGYQIWDENRSDGSKIGQIFQIRLQNSLIVRWTKKNWNLIWNPGFVSFVANLTHYEPKSDNPVGNVLAVMYFSWFVPMGKKLKHNSTLTHQESTGHIDWKSNN